MPDHRRNRGPHPQDAELFAEDQLPRLRRAGDELCWLLDRGYPIDAALALVGDRHRLRARQRLAVRRCVASATARRARQRRRVPLTALREEEVAIDGFNLLTTVEAALAGGVILYGRDGCLRDLASVHGSWRRVAQTGDAIAAVAACLRRQRPARCRWLLDRPVSNSGRLAAMLRAHAAQHDAPWEVLVCDGVDARLRASRAIVVSADAGILDAPVRWTNLARSAVARVTASPWVVRP